MNGAAPSLTGILGICMLVTSNVVTWFVSCRPNPALHIHFDRGLVQDGSDAAARLVAVLRMVEDGKWTALLEKSVKDP